MPKISIIIPVYNAEKYLKICVDSILNQTFKDFELILIDDGSSDTSKEICEQYIKLDNRVKVIEQSNKGVSVARNNGLENSCGEYIMFCDSDDWIEEECLENLYYKFIQDKNTDIIFSGIYKEFYFNDKKIMNKIEGISEELNIDLTELDLYLKYIYESFLELLQSPCAKLYSNKIIKNNNLYFDENMICYEDFDFNLRYLYHSRKIIFSKFNHYHYRIIKNKAGLDKRKKNDLVYEVSKIHKSINKLLIKTKASEQVIDYIEYSFIETYSFVLKKIVIEEKNIDKKERNDILVHLFNDEEFLKFFYIQNKVIRFYRVIKKLIDFKLYTIAFFIIKQRLG